jgi:hypothetical protein
MAHNVQLPDLASRILEKKSFQAAWAIFLFLLVIFVSWPIRDFFLVCWVYGSDAYFHHGMRVLPGKPVRFSNGQLVPQLLDMVTGFGAFFVTVAGLSLLLIFALRLYERHSRKS